MKYDHYRSGQRRKRARAVLIPLLSVMGVLLVAALFFFHVPARIFGTNGPRKTAGKLTDLFQAGKYDDVIAATDAVLVGDPLNPVALSYKGFASFYKSAAQNAAEERMPYLDQAIVSLRRARLTGTTYAGAVDYVLG